MAVNSFNVKGSAINFPPQAAPPSSPALGDVYSDASGVLFRWDGASWTSVGVTDAADITYDPAASGLTATDVQAAIDEVEDRVDTAEDDITMINSALGAHIADTTTHGTTGDIVGTSDTQTLTNKTINASNNTVTNIANANIAAAAGIDASKIGGGAVDNTEYSYLDGVTSAIQTQLNGKQVSGNYITALTGDATATGPNSAAITFATVNSNVGSFGSATQAVAVTVNAKGLVTAASSTAIAIPFSQVSGTVPINQGGTGQTSAAASFNALSPMTTSGDIIYGGASGVGTRLPKGSNGQVLTLTSGVPSWTATSGSTPPLITNYLSGSGTHTFTGFPVYVRIRMVGGGGGGSGSSLSSAGNGGTGGNTTFGTSLLVANGGIGGVWASGGGTGGTASLGSGPTGMAISGSYGLGGQYAGAGTRISGGNGGNAPFFSGGGAGGDYSVAGFAGTTNTGGGGQGGGSNAIASIAGSGGGSGGFIDAVISGSTLSGLSGSAAYAVGTGGTAGTAGTLAGGPGADGQLEVTEYY